MLGKRLRMLREERKLDQEDIARVIGTSRGNYSNYETGRRTPREETLQKLADFYGTTIDFITGRTDEREPIEKIRYDVQSSTPDLNKILRETQPTWNGKPLTSEQADVMIDFLETILKRAKDHKKESEKE